MGRIYQKIYGFQWLFMIFFAANSFSESLVVITESETTAGKPVSVHAHFVDQHPLTPIAEIPIPGSRLKKIQRTQSPMEEFRLETEFYEERKSGKSTTWNYPVTFKFDPFRLDTNEPYVNTEERLVADSGVRLSIITSQFQTSSPHDDHPSLYIWNGVQDQDNQTKHVSFVTVIGADTDKPLTKPFALKGTIALELGRIVNVDRKTWWLLTHDEGNGFGYLYRIQEINGDWSFQEELSLSGIRFSLVMAKGTLPDQLFLAVDNRLSAIQSEQYNPNLAEFTSPIRSMWVDGNTIYIGESGNIHEFDLRTQTIRGTLQLNSGMVISILPRASDAEKVPRINSQPNYVRIDMNDTGLLFSQNMLQEYQWDWTIEAENEMLLELERERKSDYHDWLNISSKDMLTRDDQNPVILKLQYKSTSSDSNHKFYTHRIPLLPRANRIQRNPTIQWVVQNGVYEDAQPFIHSSSQPPYGIRNVRRSPAEHAANPSDILIVDTLSIVRGAITREKITDRLRKKGRVVLLLDPLESQFVPFINQWLSPWNITSAFETEIVTSETWPFSNKEGIPFYTSAGTGQHFFHRNKDNRWGYAEIPFESGTLAVFSSPDMFLNGDRNDFQPQRPALTKLLNLMQSEEKFSDKDQDGILDVIENVSDSKGLVPAAFQFDRDSDGLPDGEEDQNQNGKLDLGETHPGNKDTDVDGIWDGADSMPIATLDAPVLLSVSPQNGPAEGGYLLTITGQNFTPRSKIWIDTQKATVISRKLPSVLLVAAPPIMFPRKNVPIRLHDHSTQTVATLENGFSYDDRSEFAFELDHFHQITQQYRQYSGSFEISVPNLNKHVDGLILSFTAKSKSGLVDLTFVPDVRNRNIGKNGWESIERGGVFTIPNAARNKVYIKPLGVLYWTADLREAKDDEFQIQFGPSRGHVLHGGYFLFKERTLTLDVNPNSKTLTGRVIE
jgi:hypothetical protein